MVSITARDLCVTFPLQRGQAGRAQSEGGLDAAAVADARLDRDVRGRIVGVRALAGIDLSLRSGDRLAIIGRNGAGKTTLLQVLAGVLMPTRGEVVMSGRTTNLINLNLGMQTEATGSRNITLRGLAAGHTKAEIERRRSDIADFAELGRFIDMPIDTYSSGMRMRLSFAIATAFEPEILLLDEWLSAGDAAFRRKATDRMARFAERAGILVLASHNKDLLLGNCNRAIWLEGGRLKGAGTVEETLASYEAAVRAAAS